MPWAADRRRAVPRTAHQFGQASIAFEALLGETLDDGQEVLGTVTQLVDKELLMGSGALALRDVLQGHDGNVGSTVISDDRGSMP
jgi:hypothetical protein